MGEISVMVDAGKATAAAPLGPALGPLGVNIGEVVAQINDKTKEFVGMKVPVKVIVNADKTVDIDVGMPPTSAMIKKELNLKTAAANPKTETVGDLSIDQVKKIAHTKYDKLSSQDIKHAVAEVVGTCNSMGVTIEGKRGQEMQEAIKAGQYDSQLSE
jgi:large subunit ribosomal protein L11